MIQKTNNMIEKEIGYFDVIYSLLKYPYNVNSLIKLVFLSLAINNTFDISTLCNRKQNLAKELLSNLLNISNNFECEMTSVLNIIDKLRKSDTIKINGDKIELVKNIEFQSFSSFINSKNSLEIIKSVTNLSTESFMGEVLKYV